MAQRLPNPRWAKIHRNYTVEETARLFGVHRNTVRQWIKQGLPVCDDQRPLLILGHDLADFLTRKRTSNKQPCKPGEVYCVRCRLPRSPAGGFADYEPLTATSGNLIGICPQCEGLIYRRVSLAKLAAAKGNLSVSVRPRPDHIVERGSPSVNSDFGTGA